MTADNIAEYREQIKSLFDVSLGSKGFEFACKANDSESGLNNENSNDDIDDEGLPAPKRICKEILHMKKKHFGNQERHIKTIHKDLYAKIKEQCLPLVTNVSNASNGTADDSASELGSSDDEEIESNAKKAKKTKETFQCKINHEIKINMSFQKLKRVIVELIAKNGLPIRFITFPAFQDLLQPILRGLAKSAFIINRDTVPQILSDEAWELRMKISKMTTNKFISLQIDSATRLDRSFLGVNIQFRYEENIVVCNLGLVLLTESHTGDYLKTVIIDLLKQFDIKLEQIISVTCDNGANMIKCVSLLDQHLEKREARIGKKSAPVNLQAMDMENTNESNVLSNEVNETAIIRNSNELNHDIEDFSIAEVMLVSEEYGDTVAESVNNEDFTFDDFVTVDFEDDIDRLFPVIDFPNIQTVRCSEHTLQLAVTDSLKNCRSILPVTNKVINIVKNLRTPSMRNLLTTYGCKRNFILNNKTRWMSTFDMYDRFIENKSFVLKISEIRPDLNLLSKEWDEVETLRNSLLPSKTATMELQKKDICFTELYRSWTVSSLKTNKIDSPLAREIVKNMRIRECKLFEQPIYLANMYIDPRFKNVLKNDVFQKETAILYLKQLNRRIHRLKEDLLEKQRKEIERNEKKTAQKASKIPQAEIEEDEFQIFINTVNGPAAEGGSMLDERVKVTELDVPFERMLREFYDEPSIRSKDSLSTFWKTKEKTYPNIYAIYLILSAIPCTQVEVERLFSGLKIILSEHRNKLSEETLANIILIRCNWDLMRKIS